MKKDEGFIFSKELRDRMAKFGDMEAKDALKSPDFFNELLEHAGMTKQEQKSLWEKVGRPDCFDDN